MLRVDGTQYIDETDGVTGTTLKARDMNFLQEELATAIEATGLSLTSFAQLKGAIPILSAQNASSSVPVPALVSAGIIHGKAYTIASVGDTVFTDYGAVTGSPGEMFIAINPTGVEGSFVPTGSGSVYVGTPFLMKRDTAGRSQTSDPSAAQDIATKNYVDTRQMYTRGIMPTTAVSALNTNYPILPTTNDTISLTIGLYEFECYIVLTNSSAASHTLYFSPVGAGTATCDTEFIATASNAATGATITLANGYKVGLTSASNTGTTPAVPAIIPAAVTVATTRIFLLKGTISVTVPGTLIPSLQIGGTIIGQINQGTGSNYNYFKITQLSSTATTLATSNWS